MHQGRAAGVYLRARAPHVALHVLSLPQPQPQGPPLESHHTHPPLCPQLVVLLLLSGRCRAPSCGALGAPPRPGRAAAHRRPAPGLQLAAEWPPSIARRGRPLRGMGRSWAIRPASRGAWPPLYGARRGCGGGSRTQGCTWACSLRRRCPLVRNPGPSEGLRRKWGGRLGAPAGAQLRPLRWRRSPRHAQGRAPRALPRGRRPT